MQIRNARADDLSPLLEIYNHYVVHTHITFDVDPQTLDERRVWLSGFSDSGRHRLLVAESDDRVIGYASSGRFRTKPAYDSSVETTIYLATDATGAGIGKALYGRLLEILEAEAGVHRAYGGVAVPNEASIALHEALGFERVARFGEVGFKFERYWDVVWFERAL